MKISELEFKFRKLLQTKDVTNKVFCEAMLVADCAITKAKRYRAKIKRLEKELTKNKL